MYTFETLPKTTAAVKADRLWNKKCDKNGEIVVNEVCISLDKDITMPHMEFYIHLSLEGSKSRCHVLLLVTPSDVEFLSDSNLAGKFA